MSVARLGGVGISGSVPALYRMSPGEATRFVRKCAGALRSHASDFAMGWDRENALAAFDTVVATLLDFRDHYPAEHANIDLVLSRHGYKTVQR